MVRHSEMHKKPRGWYTRRGAHQHILCQYIRGQGTCRQRHRLDGAQIVGGRLAGLSIGDRLEGDLLSFVESLQSGAFDGADMHENVLAAVIRLDEAEAFLAVEPLHGSLRHMTVLSSTC